MKPVQTFLSRTGHQGFSLVEVLVALLVLSIGLLGLAALQTTSLQYNTGSYFRTQATLLAYDIIDRMRANLGAVANSGSPDGGVYDVPDATSIGSKVSSYDSCIGSTCNCNTASCSSNNLAIYDIGNWYYRTVATLPNAQTTPPTINIDANGQATITMRWKERDLPWSQTWIVQLISPP
jgi:type IV pilus assembly protein PilV